ncbi:hypothetical protein BF49_2754 [Bradyrhizobium sp.]|nr:hypothetical protein BF49_2754 [Bradyrhizobium sp.]
MPCRERKAYCQFASYQQCLATASGTSSHCGISPRYAFSQQRDY